MSTSTYTLETPRIRARVGKCLIKPLHDGCDWLHFLDYDSLHCTGCPSITQIDRAYDAYKDLGIGKTDLIYGACNHNPSSRDRANTQTTFHLCTAWPKGTVRPVHGKDAADRALITRATELIGNGHLSDRFEEAIIASGDHLFALVAHRLRQAGLTVHLVIAHLQGLSKDLERAADGCIWHLHEKRCLRHQTPGARYAIAA